MNIKDLEKKLHNEIPLTKLMEFKINTLEEKKLITLAPLNININDKGTAFAGSLSTMATISAWSVCYLLVDELKYKNPMIAIVDSKILFKKPITKDIVCHTFLPTTKEIETMKDKLKDKNSASIKIKAHIIEDENICLEFEGIYVIKL